MQVLLRTHLFAVLVIAIVLAAEITPGFRFADVTIAKRLDFRHQSSATSNKYLIETMGGGVALFDFNNDGRLDAFFTNGAALADPMPPDKMPDKSDSRFWNRLYQQGAEGAFTDVTEEARVSGKLRNRYSMGVATGDFDNDGFMDLYVTAYGGNTLYRNLGDGTFQDVTAEAGVAGEGWSSSAGFFDYDNDGRLDLFVGRYVDWNFGNNRYCGEKKPGGRAYCHPDNFAGVANLLFRNLGKGKFEDVSRRAGIANPAGKALGIAFADFDNDGWTDVYVANDSVQCFLYRNNHDGTFSDVSLPAGAGFNEDGKTFAGMGTDFSDYDNDGWPDIVVTDLSNEQYVLFRNNRDGTFADTSTQSGIARATHLYSGWSTRLGDFDNDGWKDLFVAQGHVMDTIETTAPNLRYLQPPLLLRNNRGTFMTVNAGAAFQSRWAGRGAAFGDLDRDGDLDIIVANVGQAAYVLRNEEGNRKNWVALELTGVKSNRDGIGCRVKLVRASGQEQHETVNTAVGYLSASDKRVLLGLGTDKLARYIEVRWPSGRVQKVTNVVSGHTIQLTEPSGP